MNAPSRGGTKDAAGTPEAVAPDDRLLRLARRYIWWTEPERTVSENLPRLVVAVMESGTWEDANELVAILGRELFDAVLDRPPPGVISAKSLAFWHARLGRPGDPPSPTRRMIP